MPTLAQYATYMGQRLAGRAIDYTANANGHSTTTLLDDDLRTVSTATQRYVDAYLWAPTAAAADRERQITTFAPSTGTLTVTPAVSAGAVYNAMPYQLWAYLERANDVPLLINEALKRTLVVTEFNFTPPFDQLDIDLTTQKSWITNRAWVRRAQLTTAPQIQTITESGSPGGGTFTVTFNGLTSGNLAYDVTAASLQSTLRALTYPADLGSVTVTRTGTTTNFVWTVTMTGVGRYAPRFILDGALLTGGTSPTVTSKITQTATFLTLDGELEQMGPRVLLHTGRTFSDTGTDRIYVQGISRAYDQCRASATAAFGSQTGLTADAHEAIPPVEWVALGALCVAAQDSVVSLGPNMQDAVARNLKTWLARYRALTEQNFVLQRDAPLELTMTDGFGPAPRANPSAAGASSVGW